MTELETLRYWREELDGPNHHHRDEQLTLSGRWGTCAECPRDEDGLQCPTKCKNTDRYDHNLKDPVCSFVENIICNVRRGIHLKGEFKD